MVHLESKVGRCHIKKHLFLDTDEIPGFFLLLINHIFIARREAFTYKDIGVAMVTNMISQLQVTRELAGQACGLFYSNFAVIEFCSSSLGFDFLEQKIEVLLFLFLRYNFISEFENIFAISELFNCIFSKINKKSCVLCGNFTSICKINRALHGRLGIGILSSRAESISHE